MAERNVIEELCNVVEHYPLFPGDTLSHATASECAARGWVVRNAEGNWIPTAAGIRAYESNPQRHGGASHA